MSDPPHIFSSWTLPFRPKPCAIACLYQRCPATSLSTRWRPAGRDFCLLFLHLQPKKSPRRGSWTTAVSCHGRLTFQRRRPRLATKPLATWLILALKIRPQSAKASAGSQPLRRNELDARAISAARTLLDAKEVKRTHDGAWRPISGEAHNVTTATDVETTDRASEGR